MDSGTLAPAPIVDLAAVLCESDRRVGQRSDLGGHEIRRLRGRSPLAQTTDDPQPHRIANRFAETETVAEVEENFSTDPFATLVTVGGIE